MQHPYKINFGTIASDDELMKNSNNSMECKKTNNISIMLVARWGVGQVTGLTSETIILLKVVIARYIALCVAPLLKELDK